MQTRTQENPKNEPNMEEEVKVKKLHEKHEKNFDLLRRMATWLWKACPSPLSFYKLFEATNPYNGLLTVPNLQNLEHWNPHEV